MKISSRGLALIKAEEGFRSRCYRDAVSLPTIGFGTLIDEPAERIWLTQTINTHQAEGLLLRDLEEKVYPVLARFVTAKLTQSRFDALCSFIYNIGPDAFRGSTLRKKLNFNAADATIRAEFLRWCKGSYKDGLDNDGDGLIDEPGEKAPIPGLLARRKREADLYFS